MGNVAGATAPAPISFGLVLGIAIAATTIGAGAGLALHSAEWGLKVAWMAVFLTSFGATSSSVTTRGLIWLIGGVVGTVTWNYTNPADVTRSGLIFLAAGQYFNGVSMIVLGMGGADALAKARRVVAITAFFMLLGTAIAILMFGVDIVASSSNQYIGWTVLGATGVALTFQGSDKNAPIFIGLCVAGIAVAVANWAPTTREQIGATLTSMYQYYAPRGAMNVIWPALWLGYILTAPKSRPDALRFGIANVILGVCSVSLMLWVIWRYGLLPPT